MYVVTSQGLNYEIFKFNFQVNAICITLTIDIVLVDIFDIKIFFLKTCCVDPGIVSCYIITIRTTHTFLYEKQLFLSLTHFIPIACNQEQQKLQFSKQNVTFPN